MIFLNTCWHLPSLFHASSKRMIAVWLHMQNQTVKWKNYPYNFSTTACGSHCWALSSVLPSCSSWTGWLHLSPLELSESCISTSTTGSQVHYNIKWFKVKSENIQCYKTFSDVRSYLYISPVDFLSTYLHKATSKNEWYSLFFFNRLKSFLLLTNIVWIFTDANWGSSAQALQFVSALKNVQALNDVPDHVKNYRPKILVLSGVPAHRQPLVDFANLLTKKLSLLVCAHVEEVLTYSRYIRGSSINDVTHLSTYIRGHKYPTSGTLLPRRQTNILEKFIISFNFYFDRKSRSSKLRLWNAM